MLADAEVAAVLVRDARVASRLRLGIPALLGDPRLQREIEAQVARRSGVRRVCASARSGRVLIELAPGAAMLGELKRLARSAPPARRSEAVQRASIADPHAVPVEETLVRLGSSWDGIADAEVRRRLDAYGTNLLEAEASPSRLALLAGQLANLPTALLLGSALISIVLGDVIDAGAIVIVIGLNAAIGYRTERTNENLLASWRLAEVGTSEVVRAAALVCVPASELVPGDVIVMRAGNVVPADARVIDAHRLAADESALTGESEPVRKTIEPAAPGAALADRPSMLFRGTTIASGHGRAVIVATGATTELANVQRLAAESRTPKARLQGRLNALVSKLAWAGVAASGVAALASLAWRRPVADVARDGIALGVAAIPEGLPVTATAALVRAMARMRERGIVVRRVGTAEMLGAVTVACSDKTGTLTTGQMRFEAAWIEGRRLAGDAFRTPAGIAATGPSAALLAAAVLNSDLDYQANGDGALQVTGSSTERALAKAAEAMGLDPRALCARYPRQRLIERTDHARYMISEHLGPDGGRIAFVKGAPEQVIELCGLGDRGGAVLAENERLASEGLRVLAVGWRLADAPWRLIGLVALRDPLRDGSADAVHAAARAGIRTVILTGDQRATAAAVAREVGLAGAVITDDDLAGVLAAPDAARRLRGIAAVARVSPADKVAVVRALRAAGEIVAMAGDGINDAPALRAADVGIAVGARSTDLARQTADVVLEDADLRSILTSIAEGRIVQDNLRRAIRFQIAGNLGELLLVVGASLAGRRLISPLGLLWINLLTDTLPGLALALEPGDPNVLDRPPAPTGDGILARSDWRGMVRDGSVIAGASGLAAIAGGPLSAFAVVGASQFGYAAACRAPGRTRAGSRFGMVVGGSVVLHLTAVAAPVMRGLLPIPGALPVAIGSFALSLGVPLYLGWRRQSDYAITRLGIARKDLSS